MLQRVEWTQPHNAQQNFASVSRSDASFCAGRAASLRHISDYLHQAGPLSEASARVKHSTRLPTPEKHQSSRAALRLAVVELYPQRDCEPRARERWCYRVPLRRRAEDHDASRARLDIAQRRRAILCHTLRRRWCRLHCRCLQRRFGRRQQSQAAAAGRIVRALMEIDNERELPRVARLARVAIEMRPCGCEPKSGV